MDDILTQLYYFVDGFLPAVQYPDDAERRILFRYLVKLGLHIP